MNNETAACMTKQLRKIESAYFDTIKLVQSMQAAVRTMDMAYTESVTDVLVSTSILIAEQNDALTEELAILRRHI